MKQSDLRAELQKIYDLHGHITPAIVVEAARPKNHPLHLQVFDKDIRDAAEAYYRDRAHMLITTVRIAYKPDEKPADTIRWFHAVRTEEGTVYHAADKIARDPLLAGIVLADMEREWRQLKNRYDEFTEFWEMIRRDSAA